MKKVMRTINTDEKWVTHKVVMSPSYLHYFSQGFSIFMWQLLLCTTVGILVVVVKKLESKIRANCPRFTTTWENVIFLGKKLTHSWSCCLEIKRVVFSTSRTLPVHKD